MLKRLCAIIITMVLLSSFIPTMTVFAADKGEIQLLHDLGIIDITEEKGLFPEKFTREDFAVSLSKLDRNFLDFVTDGEEEGKYASDIAGNVNYKYIATLIKLGYMETDANNNFKPSSPVTRLDVIKALIRVLGYDVVAQNDGGKDSDYERLSTKLGILKGVKIADGSALTAYETAAILTNAMNVKIFAPAGIDYNDETLFSRWNITKRSGRILANSSFGVATERTESNYVNINGTIYYTKIMVSDELVGENVEYYTMRGDWGDEVVSIYINATARKNVTITANQIESIAESARTLTITYDRKKKITIDKTAFMIVNGKTLEPSRAIFEAFKSGSVTFVDSGNGDYEIVNMTLLSQRVIDGINKAKQKIVLKHENQSIDLNDVEVWEIFLKNKASDISALEAGMVVGIACDSFTISNGNVTYDFETADFVKLYPSAKRTVGLVDGMQEDAVYIDDVPVTIGADYNRLVKTGEINPLNLGENIIAYRDIYGELVYYEVDLANSTLQYGYLIESAVPRRKTLECRIMDASGVINIYTTDKTFVLDGKKVDVNDTVYTVNDIDDVNLNKRQVIRYRLNEGTLKEIDTQNVRNGVESTAQSLSCDLPFDPYEDGGEEKEIRWNVVGRKNAFSEDCIIFKDEAPLDQESPDDDNFSIITTDDLGKEAYIAGYDSDSDNVIRCAAVWEAYGLSDSTLTSEAMKYDVVGHLVENIRYATNENGDEGYRIYLAGPDRKAEFFINESNLKLYQINHETYKTWNKEYMPIEKVDSSLFASTVKKGDIIRYKANSRNEIIYIEKIFDFSYFKDSVNKDSLDRGGQTYCFANLDKTAGDFFIYSFDTEEKFMSQRRVSKSYIVVYYLETKEAELVPIADVPSYATGDKAKIFLRFYDSNLSYDSIVYVFDE